MWNQKRKIDTSAMFIDSIYIFQWIMLAVFHLQYQYSNTCIIYIQTDIIDVQAISFVFFCISILFCNYIFYKIFVISFFKLPREMIFWFTNVWKNAVLKFCTIINFDEKF